MSLPSYIERQLKPSLPPEEQDKLLAALSKAKGARRKRILDKLIEHNLRLVAKVRCRLANTKIPPEDLFQEGVIGLRFALDRFDYSRGFKLSTFAMPIIWQHMLRALERNRVTHLIEANSLKDFGYVLEVDRESEADIIKLRKAIEHLPPKQKLAVKNFYGIDTKQVRPNETAKKLGGVRTLEWYHRNEGITALRKAMGVDEV